MRKRSKWHSVIVSRKKVLDVYLSASPDQLADGHEWYEAAHLVASKLAREHGHSVEAAAGVISALSPSVSWEKNVEDAEYLLAGDAFHPYSTYGPNVKKAWRIAGGEHPEQVLGGKKVLAFYHLINDPTLGDRVVVDRHAVKVCTRRQWASDNEASGFLKVGYERCAQAYMDVSSSLGLLPHKVQATCWLVQRGA